VSGLRLVLPVTSLTAGAEVIGQVVRDGAPSGRGVVVALERLLIRDERVEVRRDTFGEVSVTPGEAGEAAFRGLRLPEDAFTYDGAQLSVRWGLTAREVGGVPAARVALDVQPPVRDAACAESAGLRARRRRAAERAGELWRTLAVTLFITLVSSIPLFALFISRGAWWMRLGAQVIFLVPAMVIWAELLPRARRWRALWGGPRLANAAQLCGAQLAVPAPEARPCWRHVLVERSENKYLGRTASGGTFTGTRVEEKEQLLAQGDGPATLTLSPFGPPTFAEAGLSIEHELRFFHPDRPDDVAITLLTVAPGRVA
jgi:hypothetical protein